VRVLLSTYDSRGGVEPLVALGLRLRELGAEVLVCAPPDCAERMAEVGVPPVPPGKPVRFLLALTCGTRARAKAVAGTIRTDGAAVAATLLLGAVSRD
jgi:vancomycin aglycone glucosyltransferase